MNLTSSKSRLHFTGAKLALEIAEAILLAGALLVPSCGPNQIGPSATTQPIFGPDIFHVTIIVEKVEAGPLTVQAPITATANITVNGHVFSATAPASQPTSQPAKGTP